MTPTEDHSKLTLTQAQHAAVIMCAEWDTIKNNDETRIKNERNRLEGISRRSR